MHYKFILVLPCLISLSSCSGIKSKDVLKTYLNYKYILKRAGDLHNLAPTRNEVLDRNPGFTSYIDLFDTQSSYINFQCKGNNYDDFYCFTTFSFKTKEGSAAKQETLYFEFKSEYKNAQSGTVTILDSQEASETIGTIYVYTPYWCRWQFPIDLKNTGEKTLITFEFWKSKYNPLPDFINK